MRLEENCTICMDPMVAEQPISRIDGCDHCYHEACLGKWLERSNTCPLDRGHVTSINGNLLHKDSNLMGSAAFRLGACLAILGAIIVITHITPVAVTIGAILFIIGAVIADIILIRIIFEEQINHA